MDSLILAERHYGFVLYEAGDNTVMQRHCRARRQALAGTASLRSAVSGAPTHTPMSWTSQCCERFGRNAPIRNGRPFFLMKMCILSADASDAVMAVGGLFAIIGGLALLDASFKLIKPGGLLGLPGILLLRRRRGQHM